MSWLRNVTLGRATAQNMGGGSSSAGESAMSSPKDHRDHLWACPSKDNRTHTNTASFCRWNVYWTVKTEEGGRLEGAGRRRGEFSTGKVFSAHQSGVNGPLKGLWVCLNPSQQITDPYPLRVRQLGQVLV